MGQKEYFILGGKLIGLYCIALGVSTFVGILPMIFMRQGPMSDVTQVYKLHMALTIVSPIVLAVIGVYLLKNGNLFNNLAYPSNVFQLADNLEGFFTIGLKLYGVYLVVDSIPDVLRMFANYIVVAYAPAYFSIATELFQIYTNFLPSLAKVGIGLYFLIWGSSLQRVAFRKAKVLENPS